MENFNIETYAEELRQAGYTNALVEKEVKYMERVVWEDNRIRAERDEAYQESLG